jgi:hypothetical protein
VFYGSSHLRELHNEILRWHLGVPGDYSLPTVVTDIASTSCLNCTRCFRTEATKGSHHDLGFYGKKGFERESTRIGDLIPAGPVPLFPQGCPFIPAGLPFYSRRAGAAAPGIQLLPGLRRRRWPGSVLPGMRARDDSALTEVGCCPQTAAACKTARGQDCNRGPDEHEPTVDDRDSGRTGLDSRPSSAFQEKVARG